MEVFLETDRLLLRRFTAADTGLLVELDSDPAVMRFLTGGVATPYAVVAGEVLPRLLAEYEEFPGLGRWAAYGRVSGEFVGWFALRPAVGNAGAPQASQAEPLQAELGYRLRRAVWGRGLGTEGARALVRAAFVGAGVRRVYAQTMAVNVASRRVMEKAGLRYVRTFHVAWEDPIAGSEYGEVEYEVLHADW